jgi:hypothetical protein
MLREYLELARKGGGRTPQSLALAFGMHRKFLTDGDMRGVDWGKLG